VLGHAHGCQLAIGCGLADTSAILNLVHCVYIRNVAAVFFKNITAPVGSTKQFSLKIHYFHILKSLLIQKVQVYFKNDLKKLHIFLKGLKFFD
jgi:hypothetical protein